jgi:tetratricopeptide (TPR) repeat protein
MAKQTRQKKGTTSPRKTVKPAKSAPPAKAPARTRSSARSDARPAAKAQRTAVANASRTPAAPPQPAAPPRKPGYYEALAMYETGVRALQRHDYQGAATQFRAIIERYPEERELQERSQLYLRVCERETARRPPTPQTPQERVYAATVALNAGDTSTALDHLRRALDDSPDSDHAHYIMSVALASKGDAGQALQHLRQAITLNPENRALAKQDPDLEAVRGADEFRELVEAPSGSARQKSRKKR